MTSKPTSKPSSEPVSDPALKAIEETLILLEGQLRAQREGTERLERELLEVRRQTQAVVEDIEETKRALQTAQSGVALLEGTPEKVNELIREGEQVRAAQEEIMTAVETNERTRDTELLAISRELRETIRRMEGLEGRISLIAAEAAGRDAKVERLGETLSVLHESVREVREQSEQFDLRLQRLTVVSGEVEGRVLAATQTLQERPLEAIHERLQILAEQAHRAEEAIDAVREEQLVGQDLREEMERRRDEYERLEAQVSRIEGAVDVLARQMDEARGETALLDGRHAGLSERVSRIRLDISEMADEVRKEFANFNKMQERSRRRQVEVLEQELREARFHQLRPPEEP